MMATQAANKETEQLLILMAVAAVLIFENVMRLIDLDAVTLPGWPALVAAAKSIAAMEC